MCFVGSSAQSDRKWQEGCRSGGGRRIDWTEEEEDDGKVVGPIKQENKSTGDDEDEGLNSKISILDAFRFERTFNVSNDD